MSSAHGGEALAVDFAVFEKIFFYVCRNKKNASVFMGTQEKNCDNRREIFMKKEKVTIKEEVSYDPYEEIANAIVIQACNDYKKAYKQSLRRSGIVGEADEELAELEEFFRSDWYKKLTEVDGEYLMERIRNEVLKHEKKP